MIRVMLFLVVTAISSVLSIFAAQTEFVVLVTADGLRHQELFGGVDAELVKDSAKTNSGAERPAELRKKFWAESEKERREKLMPFLWKELVKEGVVYGNRALGSKVVCRNPHWFSYPGYAEILNGGPVAAVDSNDSVFSPRETILEFLKRKYKLDSNEVAAFGSWEVFNYITMQKEGAIFCNAGYEAIDPSSKLMKNDRMRQWSALQFEMLTPWDSVRHDAVTLNLALEYMASEKPRFLYIALGETDDWAHNGRYDYYLEAARFTDKWIEDIWNTVQSMPQYKGKTTLVLTTDHGRGDAVKKEWTSHGSKIQDAYQIWFAAMGPDTAPTGEAKTAGQLYQQQVAATIARLLGLTFTANHPVAEPISNVLKK